MQKICISPQKDKMPAPHHSMFTGQMLFPTPSQQRQSTKSYFFLCKQINNILYIYKKQSKSKIKTPFLSNLICFNLAHTDIAGTCVCLSVCMFNCVSLSRSMLLCSASTSSKQQSKKVQWAYRPLAGIPAGTHRAVQCSQSE